METFLLVIYFLILLVPLVYLVQHNVILFRERDYSPTRQVIEWVFLGLAFLSAFLIVSAFPLVPYFLYVLVRDW